MEFELIAESLTQIFSLILVTLGVIFAIELCLYWLLYWFERTKLFWAGTLLLGASIALVGGLLTFGEADWRPLDFALLIGKGIAGALFLGAFFKYIVRGRNRIAIMMIAPAFAAVSMLVIYPFFFQIRLAFSNLNLYTINSWLTGSELKYIGWKNFEKVIFSGSLLQTADFWDLLFRTFLWTIINLIFHVSLGLGLALLLNRKMFAKGIYRTLMIIPWAMPQVVAVLAWRGEFHPQFGFINTAMEMIGISGINWWSDPIPVFVSCCIVNIWLGIPFMMIVFLGGLQSIPHSYYEAAAIDGASTFQQFRDITLPMLKPVVVPSVTLGTIWTFNNINVIYLMTGQGGGNEYADILVSALYKSAFTYSRYSFAAAFAIVIFAILIAITILWMKISKGTESVVGQR